MGGLARTYVALACVALAAFLGGAAFLLAAALLVPEWAQELSRDAALVLARVGGLSDATPALAIPPGRSAPQENANALPTAATTMGTDLSPQLPSQDPELPGGVGGLQTRLKALETDIASWKEAAADDGRADSVSLREKLEAWESLRGPLFELLALDGGPSEAGPSEGWPAKASWSSVEDIRRVAPQVARELEGAVAARRTGAQSILESMDGRTIFRLLLEEGSLSDAEAMRYLSAVPKPEALLLLDRLSRLDPGRTARLLRALSALGDPPETGERTAGTTLQWPRLSRAAERG